MSHPKINLKEYWSVKKYLIKDCVVIRRLRADNHSTNICGSSTLQNIQRAFKGRQEVKQLQSLFDLTFQTEPAGASIARTNDPTQFPTPTSTEAT